MKTQTILKSGTLSLLMFLLTTTAYSMGINKPLTPKFNLSTSLLSTFPTIELERVSKTIETINENMLPDHFEVEEELDLQLEPWMWDDDLFKVNNTETEKPIEIEAWMVDDKLWKHKNKQDEN